MRSMSEGDVVARVWGAETGMDGWLMLKVCEVFTTECGSWYTPAQASYRISISAKDPRIALCLGGCHWDYSKLLPLRAGRSESMCRKQIQVIVWRDGYGLNATRTRQGEKWGGADDMKLGEAGS